MKIRPVGAELFHAGGWTDRKTWRSYWSLIAILRMRLKIYRGYLTHMGEIKTRTVLVEKCRRKRM